jgi:hypothetical protein
VAQFCNSRNLDLVLQDRSEKHPLLLNSFQHFSVFKEGAVRRSRCYVHVAIEVSGNLVTARFAECNSELMDSIKRLPLEVLDLLPQKVFSFSSLDELRAWLHEKQQEIGLS